MNRISVAENVEVSVDHDRRILSDWVSERAMSSRTSHEREVIEADRQGLDPEAVDHLLSKEIFQLSVKDRNDIQEEIHCVCCLAPVETPEFVEQSLRELAIEIDEGIPDSKKQAYMQSNQEPKELPEHQRILKELHQLEPLPQTSYVNGDEFRLRFLRCELFDVKKAAKRFVRFLDLLLTLFGDYALRRPIRLSDFSKEELRCMRMGRFHVLPSRDRIGRRIGVLFPPQQDKIMPPKTKAKIILYTNWAAGYNDSVTQRKGLVIVVWYDSNFRYNQYPEKTEYDFFSLISTRLSAIHCCSPDTPFYHLRRSIIKMRAGSEHRPKLRFHLGESVEIRYVLQSYGIPATDIPVSWTGKIKTKNLIQWMQTRYAIETNDDESTPSSVTTSNIIECPQLNDILFKKGNSNISHPGNAAFRSFIESLALQDENTDNDDERTHKKSLSREVKRPKELALDIYREREAEGSPGRYLVWDSDKDWWTELTDMGQICNKIEYVIREVRRQANGRKGNRRRQKRKIDQNIVNLQGGTTVVQVQEGWGRSGMFLRNAEKRPRLFDSYDSATASDTDGSSDAQCDAQCFGMKFSPCFM